MGGWGGVGCFWRRVESFWVDFIEAMRELEFGGVGFGGVIFDGLEF